MNQFWAHTYNQAEQPHLLHDHLRGVGNLARKFAENGNPALGYSAEWAGLLHDLGKYREEFQSYLRGNRDGSHETHHAVYGAKLAFNQRNYVLAFAIAAHHAGLHDLEMLRELFADTRYNFDCLPKLQHRFEAELGKLSLDFPGPEFGNDRFRMEFFTRMIFSALVDADFLDTEAHYQMGERQSFLLNPEQMLERLLSEKRTKSSAGELNVLRNQIFQQCLDAAISPQGFFSLTVPTGGGKTLSGMAFALKHAQRHGLRRVIVVIPYLSIIEQNAAEYRRIFDPENKGIVIEHHSSVRVHEDIAEERRRSPLEYAAENWDAPIVVTTSVQFIESLFASRTSYCRKLHNIARSIVVFDEVQTLPTHLLNPLLNVIRELQRTYGVSFVFSTATQPAFRRSSSVIEGFAENEITEITEDTGRIFQKLQRIRYRYSSPIQILSWAEIAKQMVKQKQALCIVNTRRHAFELWNELRHWIPEERGNALFHLSSWMCAQHRFDILGDQTATVINSVRARLKRGEPCLLVSTQLIEAGVDVDFPLVYRAIAPLDSIVQAAGRCNREGRLMDELGRPVLGDVIIFTPEDNRLPPGFYRNATGLTNILLSQITDEQLATDHRLFERYFSQLYQTADLDAKAIQEMRLCFKFRSVSRDARVIKEDTRPVIVPYGRMSEIVADIQSNGRERFSKHDLRRLQRYMVNLQNRDFLVLQGLGQLKELFPNWEMYTLAAGFYDNRFGVILDQRSEEDYIL